MNNGLEFEHEENKLKDVVASINTEIINYIKKRKGISGAILDYREKALEEYRDDEDKVAEYFDHERFIEEEMYTTIDRRLAELTVLLPSPYFGRVDFNEENGYKETIYVGRFGMTPEGNYEPVIVDWRAPVASLFYNGGFGDAAYEAPDSKINVNIKLKRQYIIKRQKLLGMFDSELNVKDEILQMVLSRNAGEKLKDIVMTIQAEQDNLIRQPKYKTIIVNGTAGSGKTTIALHRVAYLLYNNRKTFQNKVLILGPNDIFMEYISNVLPSLGEKDVMQETFTRFAMDILDVNLMDYSDYMEKILSCHKNFTEEMLHKTSYEYINELDSFTKKLDVEYFKSRDVLFDDNVILKAEEIDKMVNEYYLDMPLFKRNRKIKSIIYLKLRDKRDEAVRKIEKEYVEKINSIPKEQLKLEINQLRFLRRVKIREVIKHVIDAKKKLTWLNNLDIVDIYKEFNQNEEFTIDDLAPMLYLKIKLEGYKLKEDIKHVVIDEAQDYSMLQFIVIKEITGCSGFTIVGDYNQRMLPLQGKLPMLNLKKVYDKSDVEYFSLNKSYRSTKEIMGYAQKYVKNATAVSMVRSGTPVGEQDCENSEEFLNAVFSKLNEFKGMEFDSIAIICKDMDETRKIGKLIKNNDYIKVIDKADMLYTGGTVIIPSYFAKGMEFDAVIIVRTDFKQEDKLMYVMATRALHELYTFNLKFDICDKK